MTQSMTGYGKSEVILNGLTVVIEIKSLNSKQLDISIKMPAIYKHEELKIRKVLAKKLYRGKIEVFIFVEPPKDTYEYTINSPAIKNYHKQLLKLNNDLKILKNQEIIPTLIKLPNAIIKNSQNLDEKSWPNIYLSIEKAIDNLILFRKKEGKELEKDILKRLTNLSTCLKKIPNLTNKKIHLTKEKLKKKLLNLNELYDKSRFEQELIYYLEKQDINEEVVRLKSHIKYFKETVSIKEPKGKKLGFISQEIGREINTIGSKIGEVNIQKIVVEMKNELEKIKEQLLNIS
tara:strand:+ start:20175 stop:21044 length:870 start_codon:yes stop_codon:yes gene_type:complete